MNKQYIKRQITLHKLGIPMDEDIQEYYDYFQKLIGDINGLEELVHDDYPNRFFWRKKSNIILEYEIKNEFFWVDYYTIWEKFDEKYRLKYNNISTLLEGLLEETFKLKVTTTAAQSPAYKIELEETFKLKVTTTTPNLETYAL